MTLVALKKDSKLTTLSPCIQIERGAKRTEVIARVRKMQSDNQLYCYDCFQKTGLFYPVRFRNPEHARMHFFHLQDGEIQSKPCTNYRSESEAHINAKEAIQAALQVQGLISCQLEVTLENRRPDLLVTYPNGVLEAHEVQISPHTSDQIRERTDDMKQRANVARVHWYLGIKAYTRENREYCCDSGTPYYRLFFPDGIPKWEEKTGELPDATKKLRAKQAALERCTKTSKFPTKSQTPVKKAGDSFKKKRAGVSLDPFTGTSQRPLGESENFNVSDKVTGADGRASSGWHGQVLRREKLDRGGFIYYVHWHEREHSFHKELSSFHQRTPVISALKEHLLLCEDAQ